MSDITHISSQPSTFEVRKNKIYSSLDSITLNYQNIFGYNNSEGFEKAINNASESIAKLDVSEKDFNLFAYYLKKHADYLQNCVMNLQPNDRNISIPYSKFKIATKNYSPPECNEVVTYSIVLTIAAALLVGVFTAVAVFASPTIPALLLLIAVGLIGSGPLFVLGLSGFVGLILATITEQQNSISDETFNKFSSKLTHVNSFFVSKSEQPAFPTAFLPETSYIVKQA